MFNILLDRLPSDYNGYLIRTSFRIGIQICLCMEDPDYTDDEKTFTCLNLLYGRGIPTDIEEALNGLKWFMSCGKPDEKRNIGNNKTLFYFDFDAGRIYSSFKQTYGIDLAKTDMHWFEFIELMGSLNEHSAFENAVQIRDYDLSTLKGKARTKMQQMKQNLTPEMKLSSEEQDKIDEFNALFYGGDVNG